MLASQSLDSGALKISLPDRDPFFQWLFHFVEIIEDRVVWKLSRKWWGHEHLKVIFFFFFLLFFVFFCVCLFFWDIFGRLRMIKMKVQETVRKCMETKRSPKIMTIIVGIWHTTLNSLSRSWIGSKLCPDWQASPFSQYFSIHWIFESNWELMYDTPDRLYHRHSIVLNNQNGCVFQSVQLIVFRPNFSMSEPKGCSSTSGCQQSRGGTEMDFWSQETHFHLWRSINRNVIGWIQKSRVCSFCSERFVNLNGRITEWQNDRMTVTTKWIGKWERIKDRWLLMWTRPEAWRTREDLRETIENLRMPIGSENSSKLWEVYGRLRTTVVTSQTFLSR
jgi:hypothetical protein